MYVNCWTKCAPQIPLSSLAAASKMRYKTPEFLLIYLSGVRAPEGALKKYWFCRQRAAGSVLFLCAEIRGRIYLSFGKSFRVKISTVFDGCERRGQYLFLRCGNIVLHYYLIINIMGS